MTVEWLGPKWLERPAELCCVRIFHRPVKLSLDGPAYGDAAIEHILKLKHLRSLKVEDTSVTREGIDRLQRGLPNCQIN